MNFHIEDEAVDDETHVIELGGEVDLYTAPEFKERMVELIESGKKQIVVDLSQATFIDSTTLGVLVGGVKRLRPPAARWRWSAPTTTSRRSSRSPVSTASSRSTPRATRRWPRSPKPALSRRSRIACRGPLAQLVEQETLNLKVEGSSPSRPIAVPAIKRPSPQTQYLLPPPSSARSTAASRRPTRPSSRPPTRGCCAATASSR